MTLGRRIQERRKQHGLSQEALGAEMGVSRQAISKWESDLTIPEIDKLIALSKLFGVSVGWLLGAESMAEKEESAGELSDRERQLVEAVSGRYLEMEKINQERKHHRHIVLAGALLVVFLMLGLCLMKLFDQLDQLSDRIGLMDSEVSTIQNNMAGQMSDLATRVEELLADQESLVEAWNYKLSGMNEDGQCSVTVSVIPKVYAQGMTARLMLDPENTEKIFVEGIWDGQAFRFPTWLSPKGDIEQTISFYVRGEQQNCVLDPITDLARRTQLDLEVDAPGVRGWKGQPKFWNGDVDVSWEASYARTEEVLRLKPLAFRLELLKGNVEAPEEVQVIQNWDLPISHLEGSSKYIGTYNWQLDMTLEEEGDVYALRYVMEDSVGQTYTGEIFRFMVGSDMMTVEQPVSAQVIF